jgi:hypothetical protein
MCKLEIKVGDKYKDIFGIPCTVKSITKNKVIVYYLSPKYTFEFEKDMFIKKCTKIK